MLRHKAKKAGKWASYISVNCITSIVSTGINLFSKQYNLVDTGWCQPQSFGVAKVYETPKGQSEARALTNISLEQSKKNKKRI